MAGFRWMFPKSVGHRKQKSVRAESLESRTLLSTFYVNGLDGTVQDGSANAPFSTIRQGIEAALQNPGDDEVVILPRATAPYTTPIAIVPGASDIQVPGYSEFNGDLVIRGGGDSPDDVVLDTSIGDGIYVDAPIGVTIRNLTINQSGRHGILYRSQQPLSVENVHITNHTNWTGIIVQGADITVRDSLLVNNYQGIWGGIGTVSGTGATTAAPGNVLVENTVSRNNVNNGAILRDATGVVEFNNFTGSQNAGTGLWGYANASVQVNGGTYSGNGYSGVTVEHTGAVSINGITASDNGRNGIVSTLNQSLAVDGVTLEGNGRTDVSYNPGGGGMHVRPGSSTPITVSNSLIRGNRNWGNAGGIEFWGPQTDFMANAIVSNTRLENNTTLLDGSNGRGFGGAIAAFGNTNLTVTGTTVSGNAAYSGGGIFFTNSTSVNNVFAQLTVIDSTIADNRSTIDGGGITQRSGQTRIEGTTIAGNTGTAGGVYLTSLGGRIANTTISGNQGAAYGGAYLTSRNSLPIVNSTITDNFGGITGGVHSTGSSSQFLNSIVAQNGLSSNPEFRVIPTESDLSGAIRSLGRNIFGEVNNVTITSDRVTGPGPHSTDLFGSVASPVNALLGPLADNGGATLTHALLPGSPAINGGTAATLVPATDQRGLGRAGVTDIGAFENQAPVAADDNFTTDEDLPVIIDVLANDNELDGDSLSVAQVQGVQGGTAVINQDGTILFTPTADFNGVATFSYVLQDAAGLQSVAYVSITVVAVNDAPIAQDDFIILDEDTLAQIGVLTNDSDVDGDDISVDNIVTQPAHGSIQINPDGTIQYIPAANFHGTDSFTYRISDGKGGFGEATVSIVVNSVNDAPIAQDDFIILNEDTLAQIAVLTNDSDIDGDNVSVDNIVTQLAHGSIQINPNGTIQYTPAANFHGTDSFTYRVSDGKGGFDDATVSIVVNSVNDAPVAVADSGTTTEDMAITLAVTTNDSDIDGDAVAVSRIATAPANGAVAINSAGQLVYTPKVDFSGTDSFVYEISDGNGGTRTASVTITVISRQAQMTALKARVQQLQDTGVITSRQGRTLQGYLVFSKDPAQTVNSLTQFQAEVQRLINNQTLSSTIGQGLIADAERLKRSVSIFANTGGGGGGGGKGPK